MTRGFTGWHMTAILLAFFGVVIAVNFTMARYAVSTFGGVVVDNSYVASQHFNTWLAEARAQRALGWTVTVAPAIQGHVRLVANGPQGPLEQASVTATAAHPLGRVPARALAFHPAADGSFVAAEPLPAGRWLLHIEVREGSREARFEDEVRL